MTRCLAFHSYKGGTGKSTIAANLAAMLTAKGYTVALLDLDVYAPGLHIYFDHTPDRWINDMLSDNAKVSDVIVEMTPIVEKLATNTSKMGKLLMGFSNPQKEEVYKLEGGVKQTNAKIQLLRKFLQLRDDLTSEYGCDYIIIDTSPGIRFWSINALAIADTLFLTLKFGDVDIEGTKQITNDIYASFTKFGTKSYVLLNRVGGYCVPHPGSSHSLPGIMGSDESIFNRRISNEIKIDMISAIPCYCDIQFSTREFLTVLQYPDHPFARQLEKLSTAEQIKV